MGYMKQKMIEEMNKSMYPFICSRCGGSYDWIDYVDSKEGICETCWDEYDKELVKD